VAEPPKHCRGGVCTSHSNNLEQIFVMFFKTALEF
jgi:hypothetical protein